MLVASRIEKRCEEELEFKTITEALNFGCFQATIFSSNPIECAEQIVDSATEALECDCCGEDVRRFDYEAFADIDLLDGRGPIRWYRLCAECADQAVKESECECPDTRIQYMFRISPLNDTDWRNAFVLGYKLQNEPYQGACE